MTKKFHITALHADNTPYRWWESEQELFKSNTLVTRNKIGDLVYEPDGQWEMNYFSRAFYWTDLPFNLLETYEVGGEPRKIYINIASPFQLKDNAGSYQDYELDVERRRGGSIEILDEEEFLDAISRYEFSESFVKECRVSLELAIKVAEQWEWSNDINSLREFRPKFKG